MLTNGRYGATLPRNPLLMAVVDLMAVASEETYLQDGYEMIAMITGVGKSVLLSR